MTFWINSKGHLTKNNLKQNLDIYKGFLPWMTLNITAIIANTNNKWTNPLVINPPKNPIAQMIIKITAIVYNIFPIAYLFLLNQISYKKNTIGL